MKKIIFISLVAIFSHSTLSAQLMSFGFVKNCMTFNRTATTNEMFIKHYAIVERSVTTAQNSLLIGAMYYSNEKDPTNGEIRVLSNINDSKQITEISFVNGTSNNYSKNYTDVYNQMISFFKNQTTFKSTKYNMDVVKFTKDNVFYYVYKIKEIPVIVISNYKIDELYFK
jgi:hypothetical protein